MMQKSLLILTYIFLLALVTLHLPATAHAAGQNFYIDAENGNDANNGLSPTAALKTFAKGIWKLTPGDTLYLRGTFTNQILSIDRSGTAENPITIRSYPGERARLVGGQYGTALQVVGAGYVIVGDIDVANTTGDAVQLKKAAHHTTVRNLTVEDSWNCIILSDNSDDNVIEGNTVTRCGSAIKNGGEGIVITTGSRNRIIRNTVGDGGHTGIAILGRNTALTTGEAHDNVIAENTITNTWATGFSMTGYGVEGTLIERNIIKGAGSSRLVGCRQTDGTWVQCSSLPAGTILSQRPGIQLQSSTSVIRYNIIAENTGSGIEIGAYPFHTRTQDPHANLIYNNTFYKNGYIAAEIFEKFGSRATDNVLANNIFYKNAGNPPAGQAKAYSILLDQYHTAAANEWPEGDLAGSLGGNQFRNNIVLRSTGTKGEISVSRARSRELGGGFLNYTLSEFDRIYTDADSNREEDPLFMDEASGDFHLKLGSPAINAGVALPGISYQGRAPDIGAFEFSEAPPSPIAPQTPPPPILQVPPPAAPPRLPAPPVPPPPVPSRTPPSSRPTPPPPPPPEISFISVTAGTTTAAVSWRTDKPTDSRIEYGLSPASENVLGDSRLATNHRLNLVNLTPETTYYFRLHSRPSSGPEALSLIQSFRTKGLLEEGTTTPAALRTVAPPASSRAPVTPNAGFQFTNTLARGSRGSDVSQLQEFLARDTSLYPEAQVTGYFGPLTEQAVKRFQARYGIPQTGVVGPLTRGRANEKNR